ncbi:MAG: hypothetical protein VX438_18240 [Planctomycetota bacterium]|nr:hypothetical protein [Planctomycetota bacterium]
MPFILAKSTIQNGVAWRIFTLAIVLFSINHTGAQDFTAMERRLGSAVAEGEITLHQAIKMLDALKATEAQSQHRSTHLRKAATESQANHRNMRNQHQAEEPETREHIPQDDPNHYHRNQSNNAPHDLEQLRRGIEDRLRRRGENLRNQFKENKIDQQEMEEQYQAAERELWRHFREAEMKHHANQNPARQRELQTRQPQRDRGDTPQDLERLRRGIEDRLQRRGENLRNQFNENKIDQQELEEQYQAAERELWQYLREAEMRRDAEAKPERKRETENRRSQRERDNPPNDFSESKSRTSDQSNQRNRRQSGVEQRIREIESAVKSGRLSREDVARALEATKRGNEPDNKNQNNKSKKPPRPTDAKRPRE